ncbi:sigma-70 family RNA polymerase sigma factor [Catenulispora rubra]|uniref:sigma-70 family RNA polymerase sigma factor n=1 Tax=Catenulispora rubra TaxID=280293 RepID=UPI0018925A40|nr:sigma-70 family RNA polymerase sigma factor [Catenulispora rubra]
MADAADAAELAELAEFAREEFARETEPYRRELFAHCYRMLGSVLDAEDLVQETYLRAWRHYGGFEGRSSVRTWLYEIATNGCLTALAKRRDADRRVLPSGLGPPDQYTPSAQLEPDLREQWLQPVPDTLVTTDAEDPASVVAAREGVRLALVASLQHLPARQRAVLVLRDVLAFPAAEVAAMLEISTASVKSALQRARATLQEQAPAADEIAEPTAPQAKAVLNRYIKAFENSDADALTRLLLHDAAIEAPPIRAWFKGVENCIPVLRDRVLGTPGMWRMFPIAGGANGSPAVAGYLRDAEGRYQPYGIVVLEIVGDRVERIVSFGDPRLFPVFGFEMSPLKDAE